MLRAFVLIAALIFFRTIFSRRRQCSSTAVSPYMNSLDGIMSAEQISQALDNYAGLDAYRLEQSRAARAR